MLSKGPNALNLHSYAQADQEEMDYAEENTEELRQMDTNAIEEQFDNFVKDIQRYDEILSKVAKNIDDVNSEDYFITDFYPQFISECVYEDDEEKKVIVNTDPELAKVIANLERTNRVLKEEIRGWIFEFAKKTKLSETLITENELLRKYISQKNKEIVKLIESINSTENEDLTQLNQNLDQLRQENRVLTAHLEALSQNLKDRKTERKELEDALGRAHKKKVDIDKNISEAQDEEEHYSKMVTLIETSLQSTEKNIKKLQNEKKRLGLMREEFGKDEMEIEKEMKILEIDKDEIERSLKRKFESHQTQKEKIMDEIEDYSEEIKKLKQTSKNLQSQSSRNEQRGQDYKDNCKDLEKKISESQQTLKKTEEDLNSIKQLQIKQLSTIDMINFETELLKEQLKDLQQKQTEKDQEYKKELREVEDEKKKELSRWQGQLNQRERESSMQILQHKSDLAIKKREIEDWERQLLDQKEHIKNLKDQMKEIKENQILMTSLREKLKNFDKK